MFARVSCVFLWISSNLFYLGTCTGDIPYLSLYSPGDPEYTDVIVRRVGDNLTLACELKGDMVPKIYMWNYLPGDNITEGKRELKTEPFFPALGNRLTKSNLQLSDSGQYICSAVEVYSSNAYSATKYILVQNRSNCARGAIWCGRCVLGNYVCDGFNDCPHGEDEAPGLCSPHVCTRPDKLNCSSGRCISVAACCRKPITALCRQPACCDEHPMYNHLEAWSDEYPPVFEDARRAPDEYGFIQSTIYTVTACALIFMIAVVLLVSAICKMHMKRAALRSYSTRVDRQLNQRDARQMHRFPPCYEASRLLEAERNGVAIAPAVGTIGTPGSGTSPTNSPQRDHGQWRAECEEEADGSTSGFGLARLSSLFSSRYRQVATECLDVEMRAVRAASAASSPTRAPPLAHYRSPTSCDLNTDFFLHPEVSDCGRDLNYMATPVEFFRRNSRDPPRPLTLQLGRFQLSIPRLGRRRSSDRRPDTPNIAEINIDDLDFVRLNSNETYTLNGRTIRLLGADFENYPVLNDGNVRPPPYTDSMRYKLYGPPPEYLSRDALNNEREENTTVTEEQARRNVEMPPCYDELSANNDSNGNSVITVVAVTENNDTQNTNQTSDNNANNVENNVTNTSFSAVINDLPAIDDVNANGLDCGIAVEATNTTVINPVLTANNPAVTANNPVVTANNPVTSTNTPVTTGNNNVTNNNEC